MGIESTELVGATEFMVFDRAPEGTASFATPISRYMDRLEIERNGTPAEKKMLDMEQKLSSLASQVSALSTSNDTALLASVDPATRAGLIAEWAKIPRNQLTSPFYKFGTQGLDGGITLSGSKPSSSISIVTSDDTFPPGLLSASGKNEDKP